jgi:hypothetical protein
MQENDDFFRAYKQPWHARQIVHRKLSALLNRSMY